MRTAKRLGSGDRISIKIRRMLRRSTAKNTPITAVERTRNSRGIRNEQAPPVSCARRSRYEETRKNSEIVEGEKHLTHQERGPLRVDAVVALVAAVQEINGEADHKPNNRENQ